MYSKLILKDWIHSDAYQICVTTGGFHQVMHHYKIQFLNYKHDLTTVISCITKLMVTVVSLHFSDIKRMTVMKCDLCGSVTPAVRCGQCENNIFCASCDDRYHRHPKRQTHIRTVSFLFLAFGFSQKYSLCMSFQSTI